MQAAVNEAPSASQIVRKRFEFGFPGLNQKSLIGVLNKFVVNIPEANKI